MYRILFIETGEYLYCLYNHGELYCYSEIDSDEKFHIYEVSSKEEAIKKLDYDTRIYPTNTKTGIQVSDNKASFEIVEV